MRTLICLIFLMLSPKAFAKDCVVLLHGLSRSHHSLEGIEERLLVEGYDVVNESYPSRSKKIEEIVKEDFQVSLNRCKQLKPERIHFVTHSLGGILVRYYLEHHQLKSLGHVVMLAPPNHGSEVVDRLRGTEILRAFGGESVEQLGTDSNSVPLQLREPIDFSLGVIAGTFTYNPVFSNWLPGRDDGTVSVESTHLEGERDHMTVNMPHTFIMMSDEVIDQSLHFLEEGRFDHAKRLIETQDI